MLISCTFENKIKGWTSIFYGKTGKGKPIRDVDQNYAGKHYLLSHLYQCFQFFHIIYLPSLLSISKFYIKPKKKKKTTTTKKKITHTNKETNEREAKIMIMEVYRVLPL